MDHMLFNSITLAECICPPEYKCVRFEQFEVPNFCLPKWYNPNKNMDENFTTISTQFYHTILTLSLVISIIFMLLFKNKEKIKFLPK